MRRALLLTAVCCLSLVGAAGAGEKDEKKDAPYRVYDSYFVSNKAGLKDGSSYLVFADKESFDKVFGLTPAASGQKKTYLPANTFAEHLVAAVVKRGNQVWTYKMTGSTSCKGKVSIEYEAKATDGGAATFASPLIITLDRTAIQRVVFVENGKEVATVNVPQ